MQLAVDKPCLLRLLDRLVGVALVLISMGAVVLVVVNHEVVRQTVIVIFLGLLYFFLISDTRRR